MALLVIASAEIVAMMVLSVVKPPHFWPAALLDALVMIGLIIPTLWAVLFRPLGHLIRAQEGAEQELLKHAQELETLAAENAALFEAEHRARQTTDMLHSASLAITHSLDIEEVFSALLEHLGGLVPFDRAKVILLETESRLKVRAVFTPSGEVEAFEKPFDTFDSGANAAVEEVLATRRSVCIHDTNARPGWGLRGQGEAERSWLGVPLLAGGRAFGLFTVVRAEAGFFTPERIRLVEALAAPASVAAANARLFDEVRTGRERLKGLSRKLVDGQEKERLKVARELHDEAGQLLSSLTLGLRLLENEAGQREAVLAHAAELRRIAQAAQEGLHRLASDLRPAALDHLGLVPALGQLAAKVQANGGPTVRLETVGLEGRRVSPGVEIAFFRIAQEALTNALRHSGARRISLVLRWENSRILMVVEDDGRGFDVGAASRADRLGLPGIRERAEMLGGSLVIESRPGSGTTLVVEVPDGV